MQLHIIAILAILTAGADAQCDFCSNGLSVESSFSVNDSGDGETCGSLAESAPTMDADDCTVMKMAEGLCCPPVAVAVDDDPSTDDNEFDPPQEIPDEQNSCSVCADGLTVDGGTIIPYPEAEGASCEELMGYALNANESSRACTEMKKAKLICCPDAPAASDATDQPTKQVTAPPVAQEIADDENSCSVCSDGLTVDEDFDIGRGATCGSLVADALDVDESSDSCSTMKGAEALCCPSPAETPCPVCSEGLTVDGSVVISDSGGTTLTCGRLVVDALNVEESNGICSQMIGAETICCPDDPAAGDAADQPTKQATAPPVAQEIADDENSCSICSDGLTVDEDLSIGRGATCGSLVADALDVDESSDSCSNMKEAEALCCPTPAENPCPVCAEGLTVDGSVVISDSGGTTLTCGGLLVDALNVEESNGICSQMIGAETICCPTSTENPCTICPEGLTVGADLDVGEGTYTCGSLVADALNFEESSGFCSTMKESEALCCPTAPSAPVPTATPLTSSSSVPTSEDATVEKLSPGPTATPLTSSSSVPTSKDITSGIASSAGPTATPLASPSSVPTSKDTTSGNASSAPTTRSRTSSSPTAGVAPTIGLPITSSPTQLVARPSPSPISSPTSSPAESTASPVVVIIESTALPTASPVMVEIESTSSPTTPSPVAPLKGTQANSEPVFAEPPSNKSTCLVAPGVIGFVLTSIVSTVYAMASIL